MGVSVHIAWQVDFPDRVRFTQSSVRGQAEGQTPGPEVMAVSQVSSPVTCPSPQSGLHSPAAHTSLAAQALGADQSVQPDDWVVQVCTALPSHCFALSVQTSEHEQTPLWQVVPTGHETGADQS